MAVTTILKDLMGKLLTGDGNILYRSAGALAELAPGSDGEVLTLASGAPSWAASSSGTMAWVDEENPVVSDSGSTSGVVSVSSFVPVGTTFVQLYLEHGAGASGKFDYLFRDPGSGTYRLIMRYDESHGGADQNVCVWVPVNASRQFDRQADITSGTPTINVYIRSYIV